MTHLDIPCLILSYVSSCSWLCNVSSATSCVEIDTDDEETFRVSDADAQVSSLELVSGKLRVGF